MQERNRILLLATENLLRRDSLDKVIALFNKLHPADAAEIMSALSEDDQRKIFESWDISRAADAFQEMDESEQADIVDLLSTPLVSDILEEMAADDVADLLGGLDSGDAQRILSAMDRDDASEVMKLLQYKRNTAGGLMTPEFISLKKDMTAQESIELLRQKAPEAETIYYIFVANNDSQLVGVVSLRDLIIANPNERLDSIMNPSVLFAEADTDQEEVAHLMSRYDLLALPVVDREHHLLGIVTIDDVVDVIEEEAAEDIYRFSGTLGSEEDIESPSLIRALKVRLPWLVFALTGEAIVVGSISTHFEFVVTSMLPALITFWTAMTAIGGNMAVQTSTIVIRGLTTEQFDRRETARRVLREARFGMIVGVINASIFFALAIFWKHQLALGIIAASSSVIVVVVAALLGASAPLVFRRMGYDPAAASGPFLALMMDATSISVYMLLALFILRLSA